ncbi:hypothetical protein HYDPIDRAFT_36113 [Hydnomerulius pinastri MD-312]|nr:hypothetical protein HYDPIDRAFT_36113 [Hydnomerulius pinastri MD-312]
MAIMPSRSIRSMASWVLLGGFFSLPATLAQDSDVTCMTSYAWASNSMGQNPCVVGSFLVGQCSNQIYNISTLPPGDHYLGAASGDGNPCQCNSVVYNLISACGACQDAEILSWGSWITNCSGYTAYSLPYAPPSGTEIPLWAFMGIDGSGAWNATAAYLNFTDSGTPASTATPPTTSPSSTNTSSSHPKNVGAVVGGVVGGVVGLLALAGIALFCIRRRSRRANGYGSGQLAGTLPLNMSQTVPGYTFSESAHHQAEGQKLYNPDDPTTFPVARAPEPSSSTVFTANTYVNGAQPMPTVNKRPGDYTGAAEI